VALLYEFNNKLNELDKALILLYLDNFKYKEIADVLGISESNVATKMQRIKNKLKTQFKTH
jgi:RNA polymerase sigma factor (sigma-70 family)